MNDDERKAGASMRTMNAKAFSFLEGPFEHLSSFCKPNAFSDKSGIHGPYITPLRTFIM
jgi:hypothetical protein